GSELFITENGTISRGDVIAKWDPYNAVIVSEATGKIVFESIVEGITYRQEVDEQTGFTEKVIIETKDKKRNPAIQVVDIKSGEILREYSVPVDAHISVNDGDKINAGTVIVKIPRVSGKTGDITGGLPRVTELF